MKRNKIQYLRNPQSALKEKHNNLPFLYVLVERTPLCFLNSVYRKPTFSWIYLSWDPFAPKRWKVNHIKTLPHRDICSECKFDTEFRQFKQLLLANDYSECVIATTIELKITKFNGVKFFGPSKCPVYIRLS